MLKKPVRISQVDLLRGIALLCMTLFHPLMRFPPAPFPNDPNLFEFLVSAALSLIGFLSYFAFGFFCFILGVGLSLSFKKSAERGRGRGGKKDFVLNNLRRFALLFAAGFVLDFALMLGWTPHLLSILGVIALVGAFTIPFVLLSERVKYAVLFLLPFLYYALLGVSIPFPWVIGFQASFHGFYGIIALCVASFFGALLGLKLGKESEENKEIKSRDWLGFLAFLCVLGLTAFFLGSSPDFARTSLAPGYAVLTSAVCSLALLFLLKKRIRVSTLELLGRYAFLIFVLEYFFVHFPWRLITDGVDSVFNPALVLAYALAVNASYYLIVKILADRKIRPAL